MNAVCELCVTITTEKIGASVKSEPSMRREGRGMSEAVSPSGRAMTAAQRDVFDRDGYLVMRGVLRPGEVERYVALIDAVCTRHAASALLRPHGSLHQLSTIAACPGLAPLVSHPGVLGLVTDILGWNVHVYHSHLDVHPPECGHRAVPIRVAPRRRPAEPRTGDRSASTAVGQSGRLALRRLRARMRQPQGDTGQSHIQLHRRAATARRPRPDPPGTIEVLARPGDVVLFDRRLWHARLDNHSAITRKAVFFGYTYRRIRSRDHPPPDDGRLSAAQRRLLGLLPDQSPDDAWRHSPEHVPLYAPQHCRHPST